MPTKKHILFGLTLLLTFLVVLVINRIMTTIKIKDLSQNNGQVRAFLAIIRHCEGATYNTLFGGKTFSDYSKHPGIAVTAGGYTSTAAGAYQILSRTWKPLAAKLMLSDFSPASQDAAAVELIRQRGALDYVVKGDIKNALQLCCKEWASLPVVWDFTDRNGFHKAGTSYYKQPVKSLALIENKFTAAGGNIA